MRSTWFPHDYPPETAFPERTLVWTRGMESVYELTHEGQPCLLYDGRQALGFVAALSVPEHIDLDTIDEKMFEDFMGHTAGEDNEFIELIAFDTEQERATYLASTYPQTQISKQSLKQAKKQRSE